MLKKDVDTDRTYSDREFARDKARVRRLIDRWLQPLGLNWWRVDVEYSRAPLEEGQSDGPYKWKTSAFCYAHWEYRKATIVFDMIDVSNMDDEKLEEFVVHELCHVLVNELQEKDPKHKHEEHVVASLTNAFGWVRQAGFEEGRRSKVKAKTPKAKPKKGRRGIAKGR